jgi:hypothetical protein
MMHGQKKHKKETEVRPEKEWMFLKKAYALYVKKFLNMEVSVTLLRKSI